MRAYTSMPTSEFVSQLREIACNAKASPLVIDQLDQITDAPDEAELEEINAESFNDGRWEGRKSQWEIDFDMLDAELTRDEQKIGLTETQIEQIKALMIANKPCD